MTRALAAHAEQIARALLGEPNREVSTQTQLRFGTQGSLGVEIQGRMANSRYCNETEVGGGLLDLIVPERAHLRRRAASMAGETP
jgi:putative DNA primase/helicase